MDKEFKDLLVRFNSKARCNYTQQEATTIWHKIAYNFYPHERQAILTAWSHFQMGEGPEELDRIIKDLLSQGDKNGRE